MCFLWSYLGTEGFITLWRCVCVCEPPHEVRHKLCNCLVMAAEMWSEGALCWSPPRVASFRNEGFDCSGSSWPPPLSLLLLSPSLAAAFSNYASSLLQVFIMRPYLKIWPYWSTKLQMIMLVLFHGDTLLLNCLIHRLLWGCSSCLTQLLIFVFV